MSSLKYWIWLSTRERVGTATGRNLIEKFGTPENIYNASNRDYLDITGVNGAVIEQLMNKDLTYSNKILERCATTACRVLAIQDSEYPDRLRNIYDPPMVLYIKGNMPDIDELPVVGIVGTRNCTPYGTNAAESIGYKLSASGIIVSTGLASGIDTAAAKGALGGGSPVIGVIGCGPDIVFPKENRQLYEDVMSSGVIISEYPPGTPGLKHHFPARNRIISGLSVGVAVIEAPEKSGALITTSRALEQGRDVFALPGNIDAPCCVGSNRLLREGAIPFTSADDIIDEYIDLYPDKIKGKKSVKNPVSKQILTESNNNVIDNDAVVDYIDLDKIINELSGEEKIIANIIGLQTLHIDDIITNSGLSAKQVLTTLTMLEINGFVQNTNSKYYSLIGKVI